MKKKYIAIIPTSLLDTVAHCGALANMARTVHGSDSQQFKDRLAKLRAASEAYPYTEIAEAAEAVEGAVEEAKETVEEATEGK